LVSDTFAEAAILNLEVDIGVAAFGCYVAAAALGLAALLRPAGRGERASVVLMIVGAVGLLGLLGADMARSGSVPKLTLFEALAGYVVAVTAAYLILMATRPLRGIAGFLAPFLAAVLACGLPAAGMRAGAPPVQGPWLNLHVLLAFAGYAALSLAGVLAAAYLVQDRNMKRKRFGVVWERLPTLESLDQLMGLQTGFGFALLTAAILLGIVLARKAGGGEDWLTDPKVGASALTWILFAVLVHMRASTGRHGTRMAVVTVCGLLCVLFAFVGVHLVADSVHGFVQILPPYGQP
jgi:ABC-type transport system involved in cytochrome c biogenesis permease subunit